MNDTNNTGVSSENIVISEEKYSVLKEEIDPLEDATDGKALYSAVRSYVHFCHEDTCM